MNEPWVPSQRLPVRLRGRHGYRRLLDEVPLRISVSGIRGKSALTRMTAEALYERGHSVYAKVTGTDPISTKNGTLRPIQRDPRRKAVIDETVREVQKAWPMDAVVLENQAITPYTMRVFNTLFARPHYLFLTNVRRDHQGDLARQLDHIAAAFGRSAPEGATVIGGERNPALQHILREESEKNGASFIDAAPPAHSVPGYENITILDAFLRHATGNGLSEAQRKRRAARLRAEFRWRDSTLGGVRWFHGAEINDVDSTKAVLEHLLRQERLPVTVVAYLRADRADRSASFVPFLARGLDEGTIQGVHLAGSRSRVLARRLHRHGPVTVWRDDVDEVPALLRRLGAECRGGAVFTAMNAVPPWPRTVANALALPEDAADAARRRARRISAVLRPTPTTHAPWTPAA